MTNQLRLAVGSDDAGFQLKQRLVEVLRADPRVANLTDMGVHGPSDHRPYPQVGIAVAEAVRNGEFDRAILICGTGIGMAISANKVRGIRATVGHDPYSVERSILSNNCQILTMGSRVIGPELAKRLVGLWLDLRFDESGRSAKKVATITDYEVEHAYDVTESDDDFVEVAAEGHGSTPRITPQPGGC